MGENRRIVRVTRGEFELEFAEDIVTLIASYNARLYGSRGGKAAKKST